MRIGLSALALGLAVLGAGAMEAHAEAPPSSKIVEAEAGSATPQTCAVRVGFSSRFAPMKNPNPFESNYIGPDLELFDRVAAFIESAEAVTAAHVREWRDRTLLPPFEALRLQLCLEAAESEAARLYADLEAMLPVGSEKGWAYLSSDVIPKRRTIETPEENRSFEGGSPDCDVRIDFGGVNFRPDDGFFAKVGELVERAEGIKRAVRHRWGFEGEISLCLTTDSDSEAVIYEKIKAMIPDTGGWVSVQSRDGRRWNRGDGLKNERP